MRGRNNPLFFMSQHLSEEDYAEIMRTLTGAKPTKSDYTIDLDLDWENEEPGKRSVESHKECDRCEQLLDVLLWLHKKHLEYHKCYN